MEFNKTHANNLAIIKKFKYGSTFKLILLGTITFGIYFAYYIKKQTEIINGQIEENEKIPYLLVNIILVVSYINTFLVIAPFLIVATGGYLADFHPITLTTNSGIFDIIYTVAFIVWAVKAKNRMNRLLSAEKKSDYWFSTFWSVVFTSLYFNFKINKLSKLNSK